jgi:NADH-quinone oxidoreductase subunit H
MIGYEVSLGLSLVGTMMAYRTLRLEEMAAAQGSFAQLGLLLQPVGFLVFFASAFAETKRAPFDLPEGESEIVGYFVEYSGMQFGLMFLSEFVEIVVVSGVVTAVFLGGGHWWLGEADAAVRLGPVWAAAIGAGVFLAKMIAMMWLQLTIRWLLPRFRYDQIQTLCWKILLPVAIGNVFVTAVAVLLDPSLLLLAGIGVAEIVAIGAVTVAASRAPEAAHAAEHGHDDAHGAAHAAAGH